MIFSNYQLDIFDAIENNGANIVVQGVPGCSKTTVLVEANKRLPRSTTILNAAFNKHIAEKLAEVLPVYREKATLNSLGWTSVRSVIPNANLNENKDWDYLKSLFNMDKWPEKAHFFKIAKTVKSSVSLLKYLNFQSFPEDVYKVLDMYGVETGHFEPKHRFADYLREVFEYSINDLSSFTYTDQIYQTLRQDYPVKKRDCLFVDECQDLSPMEIEFSLRLARRTVAVGDKNQSIYVFRGADINAIPNIIKATYALELPLSICYRCDKEIIRWANGILGQDLIEWRDDADEGVVDTIDKRKFYDMLEDNDLVTCRNTAPLVSECMKRILNKKPGFVRGRDLGRTAYELVQALKPNYKSGSIPIDDFLARLETYRKNTVNGLISRGRDTEAQAVDDKANVLQAASMGCSTTIDLEHNLDILFSDENNDGVEFSTIHRSKGREFNRIFGIRPDLCPNLRTPQHLMQIEKNLKLVEITRAKHEFYYVLKDKHEK